MDGIELENARYQSIRSGFLQCDRCGRNICKTGSGIKSLKLVFVCRCDSMGKVEVNTPKRIFMEGDTAILKENRLVCPVCREELVSFNTEAYVNIGFRIRCGCGAIYDKFKDYSKINKRLKEYNV